MYLVLLRHSSDDLPVRLFDDRQDAVEFIKTADWDYDEVTAEALDTDASTPICFSIVDFERSTKGYSPRKLTCIRSSEGEPAVT